MSSNFLFSPEPGSSPGVPVNRSLFAGATPAAKSTARSKPKTGGAGNLFGANGKPTTTLPPTFKGFGAPLPPSGIPKTGQSRAAAPQQPDLRMFSSPTDAGDDTDIIFEDDSRGSPTMQDSEEDTGMYGDEEDLDDTTIRDESMEGLEGGDDDAETAPLHEPGTLISGTEKLLGELNEHLTPRPYDDEENDSYSDDDMDMAIELPLEDKQRLVTKHAKDFLQLLHRHLPQNERHPGGSDLYDAYYLASLLLPLQQSTANTTETIRKWLHIHHPNPEPRELSNFKSFHPQYVHSPDFWDMVQRLILRGELQEVIEILQNANWDLLSTNAPPVSKPAFGASITSQPEKRYTEDEITAIKDAVHSTVRLLSNCPGKGRSAYQPSSSLFPPSNQMIDSPGTAAQWRLWHGTAERNLEELKGIAPGDYDAQYDEDTEDSYYNNIGRSTATGSFGFGVSAPAQRRTRLPSEVSRGLRFVYETVLGEHETLVAASSSWQEAVVALMMWGRNVDDYNPEEEEYEESIFTLDPACTEYTAMLMQRRVKELDRLTAITEEMLFNDFPIDTTDPLEVAIAGILSGDPTYLPEVAKFSLLTTAAIVEIGGHGTWIKREATEKDKAARTGFLGQFDAVEAAVLSLADDDSYAHTNENLLRRYAAALFSTEWIDKAHDIEGWEIGVGVLSRTNKGDEYAAKLLADLPLSSATRVTKLLEHCTESHLPTCGSSIAFRWAQHLTSTAPDAHGPILHHLSLAPHHPESRHKIHELINSIILRTLSTGTPYPPTPDPTLAEFLASPENVQSEILRFELSGYAALRGYYSLRDTAPETAVKGLVAVIRSAGEAIDGGIWDTEWMSAVEPMVIPGLLRELEGVMAWVDERMAFDVVKVVTDLEAAGEGVWRETEGAWEKGWWKGEGLRQECRGVRMEICKVLARGWVGDF